MCYNTDNQGRDLDFAILICSTIPDAPLFRHFPFKTFRLSVVASSVPRLATVGHTWRIFLKLPQGEADNGVRFITASSLKM